MGGDFNQESETARWDKGNGSNLLRRTPQAGLWEYNLLQKGWPDPRGRCIKCIRRIDHPEDAALAIPVGRMREETYNLSTKHCG